MQSRVYNGHMHTGANGVRWGKMDKKLKSENVQKEQSSEWGGGEVIRAMTGWSGGKGALTP